MINMEEVLGTWYPIVKPVFDLPAMQHLGRMLNVNRLFLEPSLDKIFRAFILTPPDKVKVVIMGQDPYPGGEADGLAFSSKYRPRPYSLRIILEELELEGFGTRKQNALDDWAEQGVLLLNRSLTTSIGQVGGYAGMWDPFISRVLSILAGTKNIVYMAWGSDAKEMVKDYVEPHLFNMTIGEPRHSKILTAPHPSAQRHGYRFLGCNHFKQCNEYLIAHDKTPIIWNDQS